MTAAPLEGQNCPPTPSLILLDTPPPLACLHCAATQATVLRDRQILDARASYPTQCVCCDCETGSACPKCRGASLLGWRYCFDYPDKAVDIVMASNPDLKREEQKKQLRAVLGLIWKGDAITKGLGFMDAAFYSTAERVLFESGQIRSHVNPSDVFDDSVWGAVPDASKKVTGTPRF
jgi:hypothetical protein